MSCSKQNVERRCSCNGCEREQFRVRKVDGDERKEGGKQTSLGGYRYPSEATPS